MRAFLFLLLVTTAAQAQDVMFDWSSALYRENKTAITGDLQYKIYYSVNDKEKPPILVAGTSTRYYLRDAEAGEYIAQIASVEDGQEGDKSAEIVFSLAPESKTARSPEGFKVNCK